MVFFQNVLKNIKSQNKFFFAAVLLIGILAGIGLDHLLIDPVREASYTDKEFHQGGYQFINPILECGNSEIQGQREYKHLRDDIKDYIDTAIAENKISYTSVYFRDLNNGPWFGIHDESKFSPSSLLKLPVLMAYLKLAETNPGLLDKKIAYNKDPENLLNQTIQPKIKLEKGKEYSISDLLERMIIYSDNVSLVLLEENIDNSLIDKVTLDLEIPTATDTTPLDFMSVKDYSALFRVLYNASYLSKEMSEKALNLLSKVEFNEGITAKLPKDIVVSHKFGERDLPGESEQLHDCGIVYYPKHPYLLCIMTRGSSQKELKTAIQDISKQVFDQVDSRYK